MIFTWIVSKETICWLEELEVNCLIQLWICIASAIQGNMMACIILVVVTLFLTLKCCQNISMIASFFPPDIKCAFVVEYSSTVLLVVYWFYTYRSPAKQGIHWLLPCLNLEMTRWILYSLALTINTLVVPVYTTFHCRLRVMMDHTCFKNLFILLGLETLKLPMIKKMLHSWFKKVMLIIIFLCCKGLWYDDDMIQSDLTVDVIVAAKLIPNASFWNIIYDLTLGFFSFP